MFTNEFEILLLYFDADITSIFRINLGAKKRVTNQVQ